MSWLDGARHRLRSFFAPGTASRERQDEFADHQSLAAADHAHRTGDSDDAPHAARRDFGNTTYMNEEVRWMGATRWMDSVSQDLRYAWRTLRRSPVFTVVAALSLGLGIGANALFFGMIHSLLLAKLPVTAPHELRLVAHAPEGPLRAVFNHREIEALRATLRVESAALVSAGARTAEVGGAKIEGIALDGVDGAFFRLVGVRAAAGRLLGDSDERDAAQVAVLSHAFARSWFESPEAAVGTVVKLNGVSFTVAGVTEAGYAGLATAADYTLAIPSSTVNLLQSRAPGAPRPDAFLVTRLRADSVAAKEAFASTFAACCAKGELAPPGSRKDAAIGFLDISRGIDEGRRIDVRAQYRTTLYALMGGVIVLLLIACTNVGNLLMTRASARSRELAVRLALGASRGRIVRQMLVESGLLAAVGATAGLLLAIWGSALLARSLPTGLVILSPFVAIRPGLPILGFTAAVAVGCAFIFGAIPALRATRGDLVTALRDGQRAGRRTRVFDRGIVALQVGLALLLVTSAGLLVSTLRHLSDSVGGTNPQTLMAIQIDSRGTGHSDTAMQAMIPTLQARFAALPGVQRVAESSVVPLIYGGLPTRLLNLPGLEDRPDVEVEVAAFPVGLGYFETLGIDIVAGRDFDATDGIGAQQAVVISENVAKQFFPGKNPVGEMIGFRGGARDLQVIGVVGDAKQVDLRKPAPRTVYSVIGQARQRSDRAVWAVRTTVDPAELVPAVRAAILAELPNIRIRHVHPMAQLLSNTTGKERALAVLAVSFGALAVLLAAIGLYGVMAFQVKSRTREIGVRMALGADRADVVRMVLGQELKLVFIGVAVGVPLAIAGARSMRALLYGVTPFDPGALVVGAAVLVTVGIAAAILPTRNAARVDPVVALRAE